MGIVKNRMLRGFLGTVLAVAIISPGSAQGLDRLLPEGEWKVISNDRVMLTSECVGTNETAECLADSSVACQLWALGYKFAADGIFFEPEVCRTTPGLPPNKYSPGIRHKPESINYYKLRFWRLGVEDAIWRNFLDVSGASYRVERGDLAGAIAEIEAYPLKERFRVYPGDMVVDIFIRITQPEFECMEAQEPWTEYVPASVCPRTFSYDHFWIRDSYLVPTVTLFMREQDDGWNNFAIYKDGAYGRDPEDKWRPDYWIVK